MTAVDRPTDQQVPSRDSDETSVATTRPRMTEVPQRRVPPMGGLNMTLLTIETVRMARSWLTLFFAVAMPLGFYFMFSGFPGDDSGFSGGNTAAVVMVSLAIYGACMSTTTAASLVSFERQTGWSRQLRLTPLSGAAYILVKVIVGMMVGLVAAGSVYVAGALFRAEMDAVNWPLTLLLVWLGSGIFAAYGLMVAYLIPGENAAQVGGPSLVVWAFAGGLFIPITSGSWLDKIASFTPMYGMNKIATYPIIGGDFDVMWVINAVGWLVIFSAIAVFAFSRDTKRV